MYYIPCLILRLYSDNSCLYCNVTLVISFSFLTAKHRIKNVRVLQHISCLFNDILKYTTNVGRIYLQLELNLVMHTSHMTVNQLIMFCSFWAIQRVAHGDRRTGLCEFCRPCKGKGQIFTIQLSIVNYSAHCYLLPSLGVCAQAAIHCQSNFESVH